MIVLGCRFRFSCKSFENCSRVCGGFSEGVFLKCRLFRVRENKEVVLNGKRKKRI